MSMERELEHCLRLLGYSLTPHREILTNLPSRFKVPVSQMTPDMLFEALMYVEAEFVPHHAIGYLTDVEPSTKHHAVPLVCHLLWIKEITQNRNIRKAIEAAIRKGDVDVADFLMNKHYRDETLANMRQIMWTFLEKNINAATIAQLIFRQNFTSVKMFVEKNPSVDNMTYFNACSVGNMTIIKYLDSRKVPRHAGSLVQAAFKGHLDVVKYLINTNMSYDHHASIGAVRNGYLHIVRYFHDDLGKDVFSELLENAALKNHVHVAKYLIEKGCTPTKATIDLASSDEMLRFLQRDSLA